MRTRLVGGTVLLVIGLVFAWAAAQAPKVNPDDDKAIRKATEDYATAFNKGDIDAMLAFYTPEAEFINDEGKSFRGKEAIATLMKSNAGANKGAKLKATIVSLRFVTADVALEDGKAQVTTADGSTDTSNYTAVWTKVSGKWLISSLRDLPSSEASEVSAYSRLKELEWLVGDWTVEDKAGATLTSRWHLGKSFLVQEYHVKGKDSDELQVTQWIGWDATAGAIRSWFFDSRGGHGGGLWSRRGNSWTVSSEGVLVNGQTGSVAIAVKHIDDKTFLWRSTDREVGGVALPDAEVKFVRKSAGK